MGASEMLPLAAPQEPPPSLPGVIEEFNSPATLRPVPMQVLEMLPRISARWQGSMGKQKGDM